MTVFTRWMSHFRTLCATNILINQKKSVGLLSGTKEEAGVAVPVELKVKRHLQHVS